MKIAGIVNPETLFGYNRVVADHLKEQMEKFNTLRQSRAGKK